MRARLITSIVAAACTLLVAPSVASGFSPEQLSAFQQSIENEAARGNYPGIIAGVWAGGQGRFLGTTGVADVATAAPYTPSTPTRIGSITKTFTGTLVMQLIEQGQIGINDPVRDYVNGIPRGREITIRELLNHTSGNPDLSPIIAGATSEFPQHEWPPFRTIRWSVGQPRVCAPGKCWSYSNLNFLLLGRIVEKVTGRKLGNLYRRWIFDPLGLEDTLFRPGAAVPDGIAHGYEAIHLGDPFTDTTHWNFSWAWSAGAMVSTLEDLRVYVRALASGHGLLDRRTQRQRLTFVKTTIPHVRYGLGLAKVGGFIGHNGEVPGYGGMMLHSVEDDITIVVLGNTAESIDQFSSGKTPDPGLFEIFRELKQIAESG